MLLKTSILGLQRVHEGDAGSSRFRPDQGEVRLWAMIRVCVQDDVRIRVELVVEADLPHIGAVQVGLRNTKDYERGDEADQLKDHEPAYGLPGLDGPSPVKEAIVAAEAGETFCDCHRG